MQGNFICLMWQFDLLIQSISQFVWIAHTTQGQCLEFHCHFDNGLWEEWNCYGRTQQNLPNDHQESKKFKEVQSVKY